MNNNTKIIIRRGQLRKFAGEPQDIIRSLLAATVTIWAQYRMPEATTEQFVRDVSAEMNAMFERLGIKTATKVSTKRRTRR